MCRNTQYSFFAKCNTIFNKYLSTRVTSVSTLIVSHTSQVEMTNSLATIGMNMTNMVLALDRLGPGAEDYAGEVEEEQIGKNEEGQDG